MKELSIEEKAKAYDGLIERLKDLQFAYRFSPLSDTIEKKFPEIKESGDEKIRKGLIEYFLHYPDHEITYYGLKSDSVISWLEKKGEKKSIDDLTAQEAMDIAVAKCFEEGEQKSEEIDNLHNYLYGKQKPADKVEPKFKVGDWVVCESAPKFTAFKTGDVVQISNKETLKLFLMFEDCFRLWDITKDAKDGDVLSWDNSKCITLFKNIYDEGSFNSYGFVGHCTGIFESRQAYHNYHDIEGAHPATKEQLDTLMKAMADAGYTFDFEKKELKKIEPKFHKGDIIKPKDRGHEPWEIMQVDALDKKYRFKDGYVINFSQEDNYELVEQTPTWSEEDEEIHRKCICAMRASACGFPEEEKFVEQVDNWLKSLKDRIQPKQEWSEKDERMLTAILRDVMHGEPLDKLQYDWLKSLRPQNRWKPSDEQMEALDIALSLAKNCGEESAFDLRTLCENLKKLREE